MYLLTADRTVQTNTTNPIYELIQQPYKSGASQRAKYITAGVNIYATDGLIKGKTWTLHQPQLLLIV